MESQDLIFHVGLALYTFDDLRLHGERVIDVLEAMQQHLNAFPLRVFKAVAISEQKHKSAVDAQPITWDMLRAALEAGEISRFQAQDAEDSLGSRVQLWARLDAQSNPAGRPNHFLLRLPITYFSNEELAAAHLLAFGKEAFAALEAAYGYAGVRITGRSSDAINRAINESIVGIPLGDFFDLNIDSHFGDQVKGAFWANFLSRQHVEGLGGLKHLMQTAPCVRVDPLENGGAVLVLTASPLWDDEATTRVAYGQLREFLKSITVSIQPKISPVLERTGKVFRKSYST